MENGFFFPGNLCISSIGIITYQKLTVVNKKKIFEKVNNLLTCVLNAKTIISMYYFTSLQNQLSSILVQGLF